MINSLKDLMEQGFRYEKDCLSKKERTTCIGNGNSGDNPNRRSSQCLKMICVFSFARWPTTARYQDQQMAAGLVQL